MQKLRWKSVYETGRAEVDRRNRSFVDCLNELVTAARNREHCSELDDFVARLLTTVERLLVEGSAHDREIPAIIRSTLTDAFPLKSFETAACRKCGLCDIGRRRFAHHLYETRDCFADGD